MSVWYRACCWMKPPFKTAAFREHSQICMNDGYFQVLFNHRVSDQQPRLKLDDEVETMARCMHQHSREIGNQALSKLLTQISFVHCWRWNWKASHLRPHWQESSTNVCTLIIVFIGCSHGAIRLDIAAVEVTAEGNLEKDIVPGRLCPCDLSSCLSSKQNKLSCLRSRKQLTFSIIELYLLLEPLSTQLFHTHMTLLTYKMVSIHAFTIWSPTSRYLQQVLFMMQSHINDTTAWIHDLETNSELIKWVKDCHCSKSSIQILTYTSSFRVFVLCEFLSSFLGTLFQF